MNDYSSLYYRDIYYMIMCNYDTLEFFTRYNHYLRRHLHSSDARRRYIDNLKERKIFLESNILVIKKRKNIG